MFAWFERLVDPYPSTAPEPPPGRFGAFVWASAHGLKRYIAAMTLLNAAIVRLN